MTDGEEARSAEAVCENERSDITHHAARRAPVSVEVYNCEFLAFDDVSIEEFLVCFSEVFESDLGGGECSDAWSGATA